MHRLAWVSTPGVTTRYGLLPGSPVRGVVGQSKVSAGAPKNDTNWDYFRAASMLVATSTHIEFEDSGYDVIPTANRLAENEEYLEPQIRSMNNRFHSEAKLT